MGTVEEGAKNAVEVCMAVKRDERVILVTDKIVPEVGDALEAAARKITPNVTRFDLEDFGSRPLKELPAKLGQVAEQSDVSFWAAASVKGELPVRMAYRKHLKRARHGHMPGINKQLLEMGMCADYDKVADLTMRLHKRVQGVRKARVTNPNGTDFEVLFHPDWKWLPDTGKFHTPGSWGNLPAGECYTAPVWLHGRIVTNLLGDFFSEKYKELKPPMAFDIKDSRLQLDSITGANADGIREVKEDLQRHPM